MIDRQPPLEIKDLPDMKAEKSDSPNKKDTSSKSKKARQSSMHSAVWPAISILILFIVGMSYWNNMLSDQLHAQKQTTQTALERISMLEQRLSSTDETMSQSSVSVQVRIKEIKQRTDDLWTQMDKLWASAWRRNQKDLADQSKALAKIQKADTAQATEFNHVKSDLTALQARLEDLDQLSNGVGRNAKQITSANKTLGQIDLALTKLKKKVSDNTGWVESNLSFRKQVNLKLDRLEQRVEQLEPVVGQHAI